MAFGIVVLIIHQFRNHRGNRCDAKSGARIASRTHIILSTVTRTNTLFSHSAYGRLFIIMYKRPRTHTNSVASASFYFALELHPRKLQTNRKKTLLGYQGEVRRERLSAPDRDESFNIKIIHKDFLRTYAFSVNNRFRDYEMEQVRLILTHHRALSNYL